MLGIIKGGREGRKGGGGGGGTVSSFLFFSFLSTFGGLESDDSNNNGFWREKRIFTDEKKEVLKRAFDLSSRISSARARGGL